MRSSARSKKRRAAAMEEWFGWNTTARHGELPGEQHWRIYRESVDEASLHYRVWLHRQPVCCASRARGRGLGICTAPGTRAGAERTGIARLRNASVSCKSPSDG